MKSKQKHPPPKVIAVDVDGTLFIKGALSKGLVEWCKKKKKAGFTMILWSSRGADYARKAAEKSGLDNVMDHIISKPGYIVDDQGWGWTKYTKIIRNLNT